MLNKRHNPVATFFILLTIVGVAKPAKALVEGQNERVMTSISKALPQETRVKLTTADNTVTVNQSRDTNKVSIANTTQDLESAENRSPNRADIAAIASEVKAEKSQKFIEFLDRENAIVGVNSISALNTYTSNSDRDSNDSLNFVANTDIDNSLSSTNANSDVKDSGSVEPDLKDSGQTISFKDIGSTIIAQDNDTVTPNRVEGEENPSTGRWWWWLPLIIGIPVIAAIIILNGQKKSDREPAIDNVRDLNTPDRGIDVSGTSDRENLSAVGANVSNVDRLDNTINTATIAEGTTTNFVGDRAKAEDNIDLDIDRSDLEATDSITEIPSTSVSEFTGFETKLQTGDNSTKLQDDDIDLEPIDNVPPINPIDRVAASELVADLEFEETTADSTVEVSEAITDTKSDTNTVEPLSNLSIPSDRISEDTSNNIVGDAAIEDVEAKEFRGDYVLQEERGFTPYQQANADLDLTKTARSNEQNLDRDLETESSELELSQPDVAVNEVADIDLVDEPQQATVELTTDRDVEVIGLDSNLDLNIGDRIISSDETASSATNFQPLVDTELVDEQNNETVNELDTDPETESSELDLSEPNVAVNEVADIENISEAQQNTVELATDRDVEVIGFDSDYYLEPTQTNLDLDEDRANAQRLDNSDRVWEEATDDDLTDDFEVVNISTEEISFDEELNQTINATSEEISFEERENVSIEEISFDDPQFNEVSLDDNSDRTIEATSDEISFDEREDTTLDEISFDDSQFDEIDLDDNSDRTIEATSDEISFDDRENTTFDEISFDDPQFDEIDLDDNSDSTTEASLDEISFDDSQFDEIDLDDNSDSTTEASLDEISFDDSQFDEIDLDDNSDSTTESSLDEISFDEGENASSDRIDESNSNEVSYEELDKAQGDLTLDLLSNSTAEITSLSDDESEDMNNITEWLESLETPKQSTDNILEWLDSLNTDDTNSAPENSDRNRELEETNDVSFQFIEDLLDDDPNQENK